MDQNFNKWIIAEILKKTIVKHVTVSKTSNSLLLLVKLIFFLSVRQIYFVKLMYYRYEIMEVLIRTRSEKVEIKVNPAFYLPLKRVWGFILLKSVKQGAQ